MRIIKRSLLTPDQDIDTGSINGLSVIALLPLIFITQFFVGEVLAALIALFAMMLSIICIYRSKTTSIITLMSSVLVALVILATIYTNYYLYSGWSVYGWHNLMQMDAIYSMPSGQDIYYAKTKISYPPYGLLPLSLISKATDVTPLVLYVVLNFFCFWAWVLVYGAYSSDGQTKASDYACVAVMFLFSGIGIMSFKLFGYHLEGRVSPIYSKYFHIDAMTIGLPSLAFQYYFSQSKSKYAPLLSLLFGIQAIISYPLIGPVALLIAGVKVLLSKTNRVLALVSTVILSVCLIVILSQLQPEQGGSGVAFFPGDGFKSILMKIVTAGAILSPLMLFSIPKVYRDGISLELVAIALIVSGSVAAFVALRMPLGVEYKFLYGAAVVLAFPTVRELRFWLAKLSLRVHVITVYVLCMAGFVISTLQLSRHVPPLDSALKPDIAGGFYLQTPESIDIERFIQELKIKKSGIVALLDTDYAASVFLRVPVYFNLYDGGSIGYSMSYKTINVAVKRHSAVEYEERRKLTERILYAPSFADSQTLKSQLSAENLLLVSDREIANCNGVKGKTQRFQAGSAVPEKMLFLCLI